MFNYKKNVRTSSSGMLSATISCPSPAPPSITFISFKPLFKTLSCPFKLIKHLNHFPQAMHVALVVLDDLCLQQLMPPSSLLIMPPSHPPWCAATTRHLARPPGSLVAIATATYSYVTNYSSLPTKSNLYIEHRGLAQMKLHMLQ